MTKQTALQLIEQMRQQVPAAGKDHDMLREAVQLITQIVEKYEEPKPTDTNPVSAPKK